MSSSAPVFRWSLGIGRLLAVIVLGQLLFLLPQFLPDMGDVGLPLRFGLSLVLMLVAFRLVTGGSGADFGLRPAASVGAAVGWVLAAGVLVQVGLIVINGALGHPFGTPEVNARFLAEAGVLESTFNEETLGVDPVTPYVVTSPLGAAMTVLATVVLAPVVEEVFFRGLLFRGVRDALIARVGRFAAFAVGALASAATFALVHPADPLSLIITGVAAVLFAAAYEWTGSLVVAMVAHSLFNVIPWAVVAFGPAAPTPLGPVITLVLVAAPFLTWGLGLVLGRLLGAERRIEVAV